MDYFANVKNQLCLLSEMDSRYAWFTNMLGGKISAVSDGPRK